MHLLDHRIGNALIDIRLEEAEKIRQRQQQRANKGLSHRLGLLLIALGERLSAREAEAA